MTRKGFFESGCVELCLKKNKFGCRNIQPPGKGSAEIKVYEGLKYVIILQYSEKKKNHWAKIKVLEHWFLLKF